MSLPKNSIASFVEQAEAQSRWQENDVISTAVAVAYLLSQANKEHGTFDAMVSGEFMNTFPKADHWVLTALTGGCFHLADKLAKHVDGTEPASEWSFELAKTASRAVLRLATLVGHGYVRITTPEETLDPERPFNMSQKMLVALHEQNTLPKAVPVHSIMETQNVTH